MELVRIYNLAYHELLRRREEEVVRGARSLAELGRESEISKNRIAKIDSEITFLQNEIVKLENNKQ